MQIRLNDRLFRMFKRNFKSELLYYNNAGVIHYICQNFTLGHCENKNNIKDDDLFIRDFNLNLRLYNKSTIVTVNKLKTEETKFIEKVSGILKEHGIPRIYKTTAINYMMLHLLMTNGFLESRFESQASQFEFGPTVNSLELYNEEQKIYLE